MQGADESAAVLPHGRSRHIFAVFRHGGGHEILLRGAELIQRLTLAIIDGHSRFISCFFQRHGKFAAGAHFHGENFPLHGHFLHKPFAVQQVQALSADLVHDGKAVLRGHGHLPRLQRRSQKRVLFVATGALMSQTTFLQKESIPAVAHLVELRAPEKESGA